MSDRVMEHWIMGPERRSASDKLIATSYQSRHRHQ
jgi:hypothetical protein